MYQEARDYASENKLETSEITLQEAKDLVSEYKEKNLWDREKERVVT